ncbi:hypothetical protein L211DRAFT_272729 [Terfezia boudieri ATCC MYA-4762]|uniref:Uncharacterized protein n=1 Tax=Terfezia boudieri ATCC MYA-4762 TaxID=1051890 RepID=A0A3N4LQD4_9PEZI|nr:hypothetical protein L211DRAFT_272729 [Terfezia boudieri ATCC MYA-4762]
MGYNTSGTETCSGLEVSCSSSERFGGAKEIVCPSPKLLFPGLETLLPADTSLRIEIQRGSVQLHGNENSGCRGYEREVSMGRSIGCPGECYSGTLGGWVYDLETEERFGVTAGHVCLAAHVGRVDEFVITERIAICQPSDTDFQCIAQGLAQAKLKSYAKSEEIGICHPKMEQRRLADDTRHESRKALDHARYCNEARGYGGNRGIQRSGQKARQG